MNDQFSNSMVIYMSKHSDKELVDWLHAMLKTSGNYHQSCTECAYYRVLEIEQHVFHLNICRIHDTAKSFIQSFKDCFPDPLKERAGSLAASLYQRIQEDYSILCAERTACREEGFLAGKNFYHEHPQCYGMPVAKDETFKRKAISLRHPFEFGQGFTSGYKAEGDYIVYNAPERVR